MSGTNALCAAAVAAAAFAVFAGAAAAEPAVVFNIGAKPLRPG